MAESFLPPVVVQILADAAQVKSEFAKVGTETEALGAKFDTMGSRMGVLGSRIATGYLAVIGGAMVYGTKLAWDYNKSIEEIGLQSGASAEELERLKNKVLEVSTNTATSSKDIAEAYLNVEKAGIRRAAADDLVTAAAKAAHITGGKVVDVTNALIAVQTLHTAKSMSSAQITDILVKANKSHLGSVDSLAAALSGKVGAALALHNVSMTQSLAITDELSKAKFTNTRAVVSFTNAIGKLETPNKNMNDTMTKFGVSSSKVQTLMTGPDGLVNTLDYLHDVAVKTGAGDGALSTALFGTGGAPAAFTLMSNSQDILKTVKGLGGSAQDLNTQFGGWLKLPEAQVQQFKTTLTNALTSAGEVILPVATKVLAWVNGFANALKNNAALRTALEITLGAGFAVALASKLKSAFDTVKGLFGTAPLVSNTTATTANTVALEENSAALLGKGAVGAGEGAAVGAGETAVAGGAAATLAAPAAVALAGYGAVKLVQSQSAKVWAGAADAQHPWGSGGTMPTLAGQHIIGANAKGDQAYISNAQFAQLIKEVQSASKSGHRMTNAQMYAEIQRMAIADVKNIPQYQTQLANQAKSGGGTVSVKVN